MKLFVWYPVLCDWTCGVAFALAEDVESARKMLLETPSVLQSGEGLDTGIALQSKDLENEPHVYDSPISYSFWGGG